VFHFILSNSCALAALISLLTLLVSRHLLSCGAAVLKAPRLTRPGHAQGAPTER
jgi:hypothetical protein